MSFEIKFSPIAEETFDAVVAQLRQRWGDKFVVRFEDRLLKSLHTISITPDIFPVVNDKTAVRRCLLHKNCSLLYKINAEEILIICFWDNRQEPLIF